jgi:hypothetical protein
VTALLAEKKTPLAIHGAGGFGKTVLATALCHEPEVIQAFPDGTVWVTLGEKNPEVERKLAEIYRALTGNEPAVPRHGFSWERGRFNGALFRGNWRVGYGVI